MNHPRRAGGRRVTPTAVRAAPRGQGGSYWKYSAWTKDGYRASVSCGSAYVTAFGATVHYE
ncbi:hypothetical protein [Janibacter sp. G56]|uniref:hypothetical protein n=1 Tax=Janibacter sp. G56 TaxID=3418717 RepID=UPI003CFFB668